ncbi:hypothetical protein DSM104329_05335 [Capillimicrobium parvum]|uniref:Uncharacterized protein n=1 Tax=Capillimicrobium parvum TaxID=2884022 RepID=A0A9E6Y2B0_9ACTN|nr:hypothetical protein DSM104329_05335 [Capillimicrobium parvum]
MWGVTATLVGTVAVLEVDARPLGSPGEGGSMSGGPMLISDIGGEHDVHGCWSTQDLGEGVQRLTFVAGGEVASAQLWLWREDTKAVGLPAPALQLAAPMEQPGIVEPVLDPGLSPEMEPVLDEAEPMLDPGLPPEMEPVLDEAEPMLDPALPPEVEPIARFESVFDRESLGTGAFEPPVAHEGEPADAWPAEERSGSFAVMELRHLTANVQRQHLPAIIALAAAFIAFLVVAFTGVGPTAF